METTLEKYKGIHPGIILDRELKKRDLVKTQFARSLREHPQTLNAITKGKRGLTPALSLKIDKVLELKEGTMLILQAYYEIKKAKQKENSENKPNLTAIREILFWDTDINKIEWQKHYKYVIQRIFERGNDQEKDELLSFYGEDKIKEVTGDSTVVGNSLSVMSHNKVK